MFEKSKLRKGDSAPLFVCKDIKGKNINLKKYSTSYTLVAFLRFADCPWCNLAIHRLAMEEELLKDSRCQIITFIQSSEKDINTSIIDRHQVIPKFPIIADPKMLAYKKYRVEPDIFDSLSHHIRNIPAWVQAIYKEGFRQKSINGNFFLAPAVFLLSPGNQKIIRADYATDLYDHESFTKIYDAIADHGIHGF